MTNKAIAGMGERFWRWLRKLSDANLRESYTQRTGWNLKCPNCQIWSHVDGIRLASWNDQQSRYECLSCGKTSAWEFHGMAAVSVPIVYWPNGGSKS